MGISPLTRLEAVRRLHVKTCARCRESRVARKGALCGPCHIIRHEERAEAARQHGRRDQIKRTHLVALGRAAQRAGLTIADIEAMAAVSPEEERLMSHG